MTPNFDWMSLRRKKNFLRLSQSTLNKKNFSVFNFCDLEISIEADLLLFLLIDFIAIQSCWRNKKVLRSWQWELLCRFFQKLSHVEGSRNVEFCLNFIENEKFHAKLFYSTSFSNFYLYFNFLQTHFQVYFVISKKLQMFHWIQILLKKIQST